jgi:CheY-like chemotaxis protein
VTSSKKQKTWNDLFSFLMNFEIILADDDPAMIFLYTLSLKKAGIGNKIITVNNGSECLHYLETHSEINQTTFLILLDINMPVMGGWEFLDKLQEKAYKKNIHTVIVTSSVNEFDKIKSKEFPQVRLYIEKPFTLSDIDRLKKIEPFKHLIT